MIPDSAICGMRSAWQQTWTNVFQEHSAEGITGREDAVLTESERNDLFLAEDRREHLAHSQPLNRKFTAPAIDITAGTSRSKG
jgi:hypothetical protein